MTPREFEMTLETYADDQTDHYNDLIYLAWHTEAFARQKKLEKLSKYLKDKKQKVKQEQTPEQMLETLKLITVMCGGEVVENGSS